MQINKIFALLCIGGTITGSTVLAQTLTNQPRFNAESIKVIANNKFPEDLECEIFVGPKGSPYFRTEGKQNRTEKLTIDTVGGEPTISMLRKEGQTNSYALDLFTYDKDGKVLMVFDLNMDGVWDVKRTPTRNEKNFILFQDHWLAVDRIDGLLSETPIAEKAGKRYVFNKAWTLSN